MSFLNSFSLQGRYLSVLSSILIVGCSAQSQTSVAGKSVSNFEHSLTHSDSLVMVKARYKCSFKNKTSYNIVIGFDEDSPDPDFLDSGNADVYRVGDETSAVGNFMEESDSIQLMFDPYPDKTNKSSSGEVTGNEIMMLDIAQTNSQLSKWMMSEDFSQKLIYQYDGNCAKL